MTQSSDVPNPDALTSNESSLQLQVMVQNTTTNAPIPEEPAPRVMEFLDRGLVLELPSRSCAKGHSLVVEIRCQSAGATVNFNCTAKVESVERNAVCDQVTAQLMQFVEKEWAELQRTFSERQEQILKFFQDAKGE